MFNSGGGVDPYCNKLQAPQPDLQCTCDPNQGLQGPPPPNLQCVCGGNNALQGPPPPSVQCGCNKAAAAGPIIPNQRINREEFCPCQKCRGQRGEVEMAATTAAAITSRISGATQSLIQRVGGKRGCTVAKPYNDGKTGPCIDEDATCFCVASPSAAKNFGCFLMETVSVITFFILAIVIFWLSVGYHLGQLVWRLGRTTTTTTGGYGAAGRFGNPAATNSPMGDNNILRFPMSGLNKEYPENR